MADTALSQTRSLRDIPALRQLGLLLGIAAAVAGGISLWMWTQKPSMAPLYASLAPQDSASVAEALRAANIPYELDSASGAVTVSADKIHDARLKLAAQGLPKGSSMGFEMIQQEQGFGTSQFIEGARYQHALEIELARTVSSLQPVRNARVHLALPKPSAFSRAQKSVSASVMLEMHPGRSLEDSQVASIVHLVASSVPDLVPADVTVIDQSGRLLTRSDPDGALAVSASQFEMSRRLEADYVRRIESLLTPMTGAGRVSAQVVADMDYTVTEEARESYKADPAAIRSEQTSEESNRTGGGAAQGVPGAVSNQPPGSAPTTALNTSVGDAPGNQSRQSTRNYELDKTLSHTRRPGGVIRKLSVAVLVDYLPKPDGKKGLVPTALTAAELAKVNALVREAVGFDEKRGDSVSVQNAPFMTETLAAQTELPIWQRGDVRDYARQGFGALALIILIFAVLRPTLKSFMQLPPPVAPQRLTLATETPAGAIGAMTQDRQSLAAPSQVVPAYDEKLALARGAVTQDPKRVAQVMKTWLGEDAAS